MTMKHMPTLRLFALVMALMLVLSGGILTALAAEDLYTQWEYLPKTQGLTAHYPDGTVSPLYTPLDDLSSRVRSFRYQRFFYENPVTYGDSLVTVESPAYASDFLYLDFSDPLTPPVRLATREGWETLRRLYTEGEISYYRLISGADYQASVNVLLLNELKTLDTTGAASYTLFELRDLHRYEIFGMEEEGYYGVLLGYVFETEEGLFYADASDLPDSCFGEDASLLPKTTSSLELVPLTNDLSDQLYECVSDLSLRSVRYDYETEMEMDLTFDNTSRGLAYALVILLGVVLPIAPIVLGFVLAHKTTGKKRWHLLAGMGIAWLVLGLLLLILLISIG